MAGIGHLCAVCRKPAKWVVTVGLPGSRYSLYPCGRHLQMTAASLIEGMFRVRLEMYTGQEHAGGS